MYFTSLHLHDIVLTVMNLEERPKSPGEVIRSLLSERDLTQNDLAAITGFSRQTISSLISGRSSLSPEHAVVLSQCFGLSASEWLRLEGEYRISLIQNPNKETIQSRAEIFDLAPIKDMQRRGWIKTTGDFSEIVTELRRFFETDDLAAIPNLNAAFRKSESQHKNQKYVRAWVQQAKHLAKSVQVAPFSEDRMRTAIKELRHIAAFSKEVNRVPQTLAKYGIRYVISEHLPYTKIDGAAFWLDEKSPVIVMSLRYDRIDSFWFTLMHEMTHIFYKDQFSVDEESEDEANDTDLDFIEVRANNDAQANLVDPLELESFIRRIGPLYSEQKIIQFAHRIKIHPGIIVGQLQRKKQINYATMRNLLVKIRESLIETALTDGWGKVVGHEDLR
jgi:HTH-type transcriptional regulator / antitoxin HigA